MATIDDPAGRLYDILNRVLILKGGNTKMKDVWSTVLDIHAPDGVFTTLVLYRLSGITQLVEECKKRIVQDSDIDQQLHLEPFQAASDALSHLNLEETWEQFTGRLTSEHVRAMRYTSDYLSNDQGEGVIEEATQEELQGDIAELLERVLVAEIPDDIKAFLVDALEDIRRALVGYRINGAEGLKTALATSLGAAFRFSDAMREAQEEPIIQVYTRFFDFLLKLDSIVAHGLKLKPLAAGISKLISLGSPDS